MPKLTNVTVSKIFKGYTGEGQYGIYQIWDLYLEGREGKFSYFEKNNYIPKQGELLDYIEWDVKQKDKDGKIYTNYQITNIIPSDKQQEKPSQAASGATGSTQRDSSISFYVAYAKDLMVAMLPHHPGYNQMELEDLGAIVTQVGMTMQDKAIGSKPEPNTEPIIVPKLQTSGDYGQPPIDDEPDIPY